VCGVWCGWGRGLIFAFDFCHGMAKKGTKQTRSTCLASLSRHGCSTPTYLPPVSRLPLVLLPTTQAFAGVTKAHLDAISHTCQVPVPHPVARVALLPFHLRPTFLAFHWVEQQGEGGGEEEATKRRLAVAFILEGSGGHEEEGETVTVQLF
jgi:hypothetical protein